VLQRYHRAGGEQEVNQGPQGPWLLQTLALTEPRQPHLTCWAEGYYRSHGRAVRRASGWNTAGQLLPAHASALLPLVKQQDRAAVLPPIFFGRDDCSNQDGRTSWSPTQLWISSEACSHPKSLLLCLPDLHDTGSWARQARRIGLFIKNSSRSLQLCLSLSFDLCLSLCALTKAIAASSHDTSRTVLRDLHLRLPFWLSPSNTYLFWTNKRSQQFLKDSSHADRLAQVQMLARSGLFPRCQSGSMYPVSSSSRTAKSAEAYGGALCFTPWVHLTLMQGSVEIQSFASTLDFCNCLL